MILFDGIYIFDYIFMSIMYLEYFTPHREWYSAVLFGLRLFGHQHTAWARSSPAVVPSVCAQRVFLLALPARTHRHRRVVVCVRLRAAQSERNLRFRCAVALAVGARGWGADWAVVWRSVPTTVVSASLSSGMAFLSQPLFLKITTQPTLAF